MDQISPPMRIALIVAIAFAGVWFAVLRPSSDSTDPAPAPVATATSAGAANDADPSNAQTGFGKATEQARGAAQAQEQSDAATQAATGGRAAATPEPTAVPTAEAGGSAAPAATPSPVQELTATGLPQPVSRALADRQVVVLLFWDRNGIEDREVERGLRGLRQPGGTFVRTVPVARVGSYAPIVRALKIEQSPAVVVVDAKRRAQVLTGYTTRDAVRQAVADARRG